MVYSPSTSAIEMNAADRMPLTMFGSMTRGDHGDPAAPSERAASARVRSVDGRQRGVERAVGERQHQHDVGEASSVSA